MADVVPGFRTRSPQRDSSADTRRRKAVRTSIGSALDEARLEMEGLERRRAAAQQATIGLMDDSGEFGERAPADEAVIVEFEIETARAADRLSALANEIEVFARLLRTIDESHPGTRDRLSAK
jgi:uncharacterized protein YPO0396